jgi:bifunctional non-homologous end joining protein LigD
MNLQLYRKKRNFDVTAEPRGRARHTAGGQYVVQKHAARRLHYDFRLEVDGVMKSWAVARGPSLVPGDKRLAIHVEDHPIEYNSFEGTIPKGEYGGGTVMIWDRGRWHPEGDPHEGYQKGHLTFVLDGAKLKGRWHLVRMRKRGNEKQESWLLIKADDAVASGPKDPDILEAQPLSVVSGRTLEEIGAGKPRRAGKKATASAKKTLKGAARNEPAADPRRGAKAAKRSAKAKPLRGSMPDFVPPALATLRVAPPSEAGWLHEIKFDGYRIEARLDRGDVRLLTRKGLDWTQKFPNIAAAVAELPAATALLDGEVVVEDESGVSRFSALQADLKAGRRDRFVYHVFDLLHLDGADLTRLKLRERKAALARLLKKVRCSRAVRLSEHLDDQGSRVLQRACRLNLEGIVSKRAEAAYVSGRSDNWIKTKCSNRQELVVVGYAPSSGLRNAIGALIVGYYEGGRLRYAGRVGTGYSREMAKDLWRRLQPLRTDRPPIDPPPPQERRRRDVVWVDPKLVIEANFRDWTADHLVRQAAFKGVREDKPAKEVAREKAAMAAKATIAKKTSSPRPRPRRKPVAARAARRAACENEVRLTHPDRVYWVDVGITKQDLADYYGAVWGLMAPHVVGRALALVRCPEGTKGQCFFQKHAHAGLDEKALRTVIDSKGRQVIGIDDLNGLLSLVQAGVLEIHVRGAMLDRLDVCDRIVFDLDPGEGVDWSAIVAAAREVRERLVALKLDSFVKLSGGKGLHVVLPIAGTDWDSAKDFAHSIALAMANDQPSRYVAKLTKSLRKGRIFVDYLRNSLEQTSVAAYSSRAREGAPVSVPVDWAELGGTTSAHQYTVPDLIRRPQRLNNDPWSDIGRVRQKLPKLTSRP